jgi:mannose-6-phosphate isomerase-like protein (cupin superfamily)
MVYDIPRVPYVMILRREDEAPTKERCAILQAFGLPEDGSISIARARVKRSVTTVWHRLRGISEWYLIVKGRGRMEMEGSKPAFVSAGDVVFIPPGTAQRIQNVGRTDLVFFCVCKPAFRASAYLAGKRR